MGLQFFWGYDVLAAAFLLINTFRYGRKGLLAVWIEVLTVLLAGTLGLILSGAAAEKIYDNFIEPQVVNYVGAELDKIPETDFFTEISSLDSGKIKIDGEYITDIGVIETDQLGKATLDMAAIDLSETGIADLPMFKDSGIDFSENNTGKIVVTKRELDGGTPEDAVLAKTIAAALVSRNPNTSSGQATNDKYAAIVSVLDNIAGFAEKFTGGFFGGEDTTGTDAAAGVIMSVLPELVRVSGGEAAVSHIISKKIIEPVIILPLKVLIFFIIFAIIVTVGVRIGKISKAANSLPVIGGVNTFLGGAAGLLIGGICVVVIAWFARAIVTFTGDEVVFLNTAVIERTALFKIFFNML
ncbi:hypothetical protein FACS189499_01290 [Clostridia bacterium]|nr:hypothetical protein FACS189499_01290 [Clostridia bacterium]